MSGTISLYRFCNVETGANFYVRGQSAQQAIEIVETSCKGTFEILSKHRNPPSRLVRDVGPAIVEYPK